MKEIKQSTVSKVVPTNKPYESQYGTLYGFYITFANGDNGKYNSKSPDQTKFVVGETAHYEYIPNDYQGKTYYTVKPINPEFSRNETAPLSDVKPTTHTPRTSTTTSKDELIVRQTALKASAEVGGKDLETILSNAQIMADWVLGNAPKKLPVTHADHFADREKVQVTEQVANDGLPF